MLLRVFKVGVTGRGLACDEDKRETLQLPGTCSSWGKGTGLLKSPRHFKKVHTRYEVL